MSKHSVSILDINRLVYQYDELITQLKVAKSKLTVDSNVLKEVTSRVNLIYEETLSYVGLFFGKPYLLNNLPQDVSSSVKTLFNYMVYINLPYVKRLLEEIRNIVVKKSKISELKELDEIIGKFDELIKTCQSRISINSP